MRDTLNALTDRQTIIDRINTLFIATDARDWDTVKGCFAESVWFDMSSVDGTPAGDTTPEAIVEDWAENLRDIDEVHHQSGNFRIAFEPEGAECFCYGTAWHLKKTAQKGQTRTFVGSYGFHLIPDGEEWRINRFRYNLKFIDGNQTLE